MSYATTRFVPISVTLAAALAAAALAGCNSDPRVAAEPASRQSALALSRAAGPKPSPAPEPVSTEPSTDAAAELRASGNAIRDAARALEQLAARVEASSRLVQGKLSDRLLVQAGTLRAEIKALGTIDEHDLEQAARALERMHLLQLQGERIEGQIRAAADKLQSAEADRSTSPETLARLREQLASLQRSLDASVAGSEAARADALRADQLARDTAAKVSEQYTALDKTTLQLTTDAEHAGGSARALTAVAGRIDALLASFGSVDRDIGSLLTELRAAINGPTVYWQDWIAQTVPPLSQFEHTVEQYAGQAYGDRRSLRVLTYNTAFLSVVIDLPFPAPDITLDLNDGVFSGLNYVDRADKIAEGILRGDQDVVVLNEVFSVDAREELVKKLSGEYPNYVARLAGEPLLAGKTVSEMLQEQYLPTWVNDLLKSLQIPGIMEYMVHPGDSGLMIFSRYPLLPLNPGPNEADCVDEACGFWGSNNGNKLLADEVAFHIYDSCATLSSDCMASKGVGLVKLDTPGDPSYVAFTHLQADEDVLEGNAPYRVLQYDEVEALLSDNISDQDLFDRRVFFAGDMNTPGHNRANLQPSEWLDIYHPSNNGNMCYACGNGGAACKFGQNGDLFTDPWGFETSVIDPGLSQLNDHARLDYLLHNAAGGRACMQYIHIAYDVAENGSHWYSDHVPMRADFNASADACSANDEAPMSLNRPREVTFTGTNCDFDPNTPAPPCQTTVTAVAPEAKLAHAGSFQWYRITQAGSYSIKLEASAPDKPVSFEVYQGKDMSRPIKPFSKEDHPRWGTPYAMLEPPYYVRVFAVDANGKADRSDAGAGREYRIDFHQHLCRNVEDACFMPSAFKYPYIWPEVTAISDVNELYFKFKTSGVADGRLTPQPKQYPMVRFQEESILGSNLDCLQPLELLEYDGVMPPVFVQSHAFTSVETDVDQNWDDVDGPDRRYIAPDLDGDKQDEFKFYYVKMSRKQKPECEAPFPTNLRFETDLTYFRAGRARCYLQYDDSGIGEDDHTLFHLFFDEPFVFSYTFCDTHPCHEAVFDQPDGDNWLADVPSLQGYFVNELTLGMWEDDNGDDLLFNSHLQPIQPTPPWLRREDGLNLFVTDNPNPDKADYSYRIEYLLCREQDGCDPPM